MNNFKGIVELASDILSRIGVFCDEVFEFLSWEVDIPFISGAIGRGNFSVLAILFGGGLGVLLSYKIILSLIPIV